MQIPPSDRASEDIDVFLADPSAYFGRSVTKLMALPREQLAQLQLSGLRRRFSQMRGALPMLDRLADIQNITEIGEIDDVLPLLFDHATYKSYPKSFLEKHRFAQLTAWLDKLTTIDLSKVDASACHSIDDWMLTLSSQTPLAPVHTSGTSGTMSFLPCSKHEFRKFVRQYPVILFQKFGENDQTALMPPLNVDCIYPYFRSGGYVQGAINDATVEIIAGGEQRFHAAYPGRLSADLTLLAARRRAAAAKGQHEGREVSADLIARQQEFEAQQRDMPRHIASFFETLSKRLAGKRIFMIGTTPLIFSLAQSGLQQGLKKLFAPDSVINTGGGAKGIALPEDWRETIQSFFGVEQINSIYGMSEMGGVFTQCPSGHYHSVPWIIPFVLDVETGAPLPRRGQVSGRFGFYDLLQETRWGGFITGDEVTMEWDAHCACGKTTPYLHARIQRVSDRTNEAGEEKLNCAAAPEAYAEALDFLNEDMAA